MEKKKIPVYCHFSFRRPEHRNYGIFSVAFFSDVEGKKLMAVRTRAYALWKDQQYVTAIQAYEHALYCIWEFQAEMSKHGITNVYLITDNSALAGWIEDPSKNKTYTYYMNQATKKFQPGAQKEIVLNVGLCDARKAEKSHKFCKEENIQNKRPAGKAPIAAEGMSTVGALVNKYTPAVTGVRELTDDDIFQ